MTTLTLETICLQKEQQRLLSNPANRLTQVSPYETGVYSKYQLDMRRKAEILKYNNPSQAGGKVTKATKFAQTLKGRSSLIRTTQNNTACVDEYTLSNRSGIPGPAIPLYLDNNIPLYNYSNTPFTFALGVNK